MCRMMQGGRKTVGCDRGGRVAWASGDALSGKMHCLGRCIVWELAAR